VRRINIEGSASRKPWPNPPQIVRVRQNFGLLFAYAGGLVDLDHLRRPTGSVFEFDVVGDLEADRPGFAGKGQWEQFQ
jgi:hypothetical protein